MSSQVCVSRSLSLELFSVFAPRRPACFVKVLCRVVYWWDWLSLLIKHPDMLRQVAEGELGVDPLLLHLDGGHSVSCPAPGNCGPELHGLNLDQLAHGFFNLPKFLLP